MREKRIRKRGEANAFFIFLIKAKLVQQLTGKVNFALHQHEHGKLEVKMTQYGLSKPSPSTLSKIFLNTYNERSCILEKSSLNPLCKLLDYADYEDFKHIHSIDYENFAGIYIKKFKLHEFNEHIPFYSLEKKEQDFILKQLEKIATRDWQNKMKKIYYDKLFLWLNKKTGINEKENQEMQKMILNKQLIYYSNIINIPMLDFLQILHENIDEGKNPFHRTGLSEIFAHDLMQIWKNGENKSVSRLSFYESYIKNIAVDKNKEFLQLFWLGMFTKKQIANEHNIPEYEIEGIIMNNIQEMDTQYNKMVKDARG